MLFRTTNAGVVLMLLGLVLTGCSAALSSNKTNPSVNPVVRSAQGELCAFAEAHAHYATGVLHEQVGESDLALEEFFQAALLDPTDEWLALEVSQRFLAHMQPKKALEILKPAAARPDTSSRVFVRLGFVYVQLGQLDDAIVANRRAINRSPAELAGYQNLYLNLMQKDQRDEALKVLEQAASVADADADFLVNLAELFANYGRQVSARKNYSKAVALKVLIRAANLSPPSAELRLKLADGFNALGGDEQARELYLQLLKDFSDLPLTQDGIRARLADLQLRSGDRQAAMGQLRAMVEHDPANVAILYQLGNLAQDEREFSLAEESFRKVVLLRPDFEQPYYELARSQISLSRCMEALATLDQARQKFSASFVGELLAGVAHSRLRNYDRAIASLIRAEAMARINDPNRLNEGFYFQLGAAYERKGDLVQAECCLKKSLELAPDFAEAQNYLGYMWADRDMNLDKARELIEKAVRADPQNPAYLDSLGWVLFKLKRPKEALPHILKAIGLSKEPDATLFDHLGDIHSALGESAHALSAWKKSLVIEANPVIQKKLDSTTAR